MAERYGLCPACQGLKDECSRCDGTGFDGSAEALRAKEERADWERQQQERREWRKNDEVI